MAWKCFLTIFKAEAPVHIGYKQIGILKTTRYYITGRAMWGAITANLTRNLFENPDSKDYQTVGNFVRENIRTTYFYPAIRKNEVEDPENWSKYEADKYLVFLPEYTQEGIKFGEKTKEEFEQIFIGSFVSTALESQARSAEEGSLHEIEYIKNKIDINGNAVQVYWIGYIFINVDANKAMDNGGERVYDVELNEKNNDDIEIKFKSKGKNYETTLKNCLNIMFVGGERNYGFGRLKIPENGLRKIKDKIFGNFDFDLEDKIIFKNLNVATSHIKLNKNEFKNEFKLESGEIEPLVGLEWSEKGAGQRISKPIVCIVPGSKIETKDFILVHHGILE